MVFEAGPGSDIGDQSTPLPSVMEEDQDAESSEGTQQQDASMQLHPVAPGSTGGESANGSGSSSLHDLLSAPPSPTLSMVTKHSNGTLNLWQLTFADKTKFSQVNMNFVFVLFFNQVYIFNLKKWLNVLCLITGTKYRPCF